MQQINNIIQAMPLIIYVLFIMFLLSLPFTIIAKAVFRTGKKTSSKQVYKYLRKDHIMTKREEKFFLLLCDIFRDKCYIIPQVHLSALLEHRIKGQSWKGAFSHINGKSVDYVLLRSRDLSVLCAVELDDSTHDKTERMERDREVGWMLGLADIPLVRLRTPENMSKQEIVDAFAKIINKG